MSGPKIYDIMSDNRSMSGFNRTKNLVSILTANDSLMCKTLIPTYQHFLLNMIQTSVRREELSTVCRLVG